MAHFYGVLQGSRQAVTRTGGKHLDVTAAGWQGAIDTRIWHDAEADVDRYRVTLTPWRGSGGHSRILAEGVLDARRA